MLTYLGNKKNVSTATLSSDETLQMSEAAQTYPADTQFYLFLKPEETSASNSYSEIPDGSECAGEGGQVQVELMPSAASDHCAM